MRKSVVLLFIIVCFATQGIPPQREQNITVSKLCEMIHERAYFLKRIEKLIDLFRHLEEEKLVDTNFSNFSPELFSHPRIKKLILSLENTTNLSAFFNLWDELHEYKYITDELLIKEFTRFTLLITKKMCPDCYTKSATPLDVSFTMLAGGSYTEAVTLRNYYTKRLKRPLHLLSQIRCNTDSLFESVTRSREHECNCVFESHIRFKHGDINKCIIAMSRDQSLTPLLVLSKEFNKYRLIQDEKFNREFLLLIFGVYKNLITYNAQHKDFLINRSSLELIAHVYENIDSLPLEQILDAIDLLSEELPQLLEKYEIKKDTNWREWIKDHWWVPPLVCTSLGIKILLIFQQGKKKPDAPSSQQRRNSLARSSI